MKPRDGLSKNHRVPPEKIVKDEGGKEANTNKADNMATSSAVYTDAVMGKPVSTEQEGKIAAEPTPTEDFEPSFIIT